MTSTGVDAGLVQQVRMSVATELSRRARAAELGGTRRLPRDDEIALARELVSTELEELARDAIADGEPGLEPCQEELLARAVPHVHRAGMVDGEDGQWRRLHDGAECRLAPAPQAQGDIAARASARPLSRSETSA